MGSGGHTITLGGPDAGNVSTLLLAYEDGNKTAVIDVTKNLNAGGQFTIDDLRFTNFTAVSGPDNLELEVNDDGVVSGLDAQTIAIVQPTISSASNQFFTIGDPITPVSTITVADGVLAAAIDTANDIRIRIPATFNMTLGHDRHDGHSRWKRLREGLVDRLLRGRRPDPRPRRHDRFCRRRSAHDR